jgi:hypothetical protein
MNNRNLEEGVHVEEIGVRCQVNITMNFRYKEWDDVYLIDLAQDRDKWRAVVTTVMNVGFP